MPPPVPPDGPRHVVFVAPFAMESTLRFVRALGSLPGVRLGIVSQQPAEAFMASVRAGARPGGSTVDIAAVERVGDVHDPGQLVAATRALGERLGGGRVDVLTAILEPLQEPIARVREVLKIRGMDTAEARRFRDKSHMKDVLRSNGLPCARHALATSAAEAMAFAKEVTPLVAKPPDGAGAKNTFRVESPDQLAGWMRSYPPSPKQPLLLEEFIQGDEFSFDTLSMGGKHVLHHVNEYAPTPLEVMGTPWIQWTVLAPLELDDERFRAIHDAGPRALDVLGMHTGITHMEWFRRADGSIAISEVAARPPGAQFTTLMSYAHDADMYRLWAELTAFERCEVPERVYAAGAAYLRGQGTGRRVSAVEGLERVRDELGDLVVEAKIPRPGQPKAETYEGEGYLILRSKDTDVVRDGLRRAVQMLRVHLDPA